MTVTIYNIARKHRPYIEHMIKEMEYYDDSIEAYNSFIDNSHDDGVYSLGIKGSNLVIMANENRLKIEVGYHLTGFEIPRTDFFEVSII